MAFQEHIQKILTSLSRRNAGPAPATIAAIGACCLLLSVLCPLPLAAVDTIRVTSPDPILEDWRWTVFDKKDGLMGSVFTVYEDANHNIWFGTDKGVQRYDGLRWTTYTPDDGLVDSEIWAIMQDRDGQMWFGGKGAVSRLSFADGKEVWTTFTLDTQGWVHRDAMFQSRDGAIWIGFASGRGGSIQRYSDGEWSVVTPGAGRPDPNASKILELPDGSMWFGTLEGMVRRDGRRWTLDPIGRHSAEMTAEDTILAVTTAGEMIWYTADSSRRVTPRTALGEAKPRVARDGTLWTSGRNHIARFDGEDWQVYPELDERLKLGGYTNLRPVTDGMWLWSHRNDSVVRFRSDARATYFTHSDSLDLKTDGPDGSIWLLQRSRPTEWEQHIGEVDLGKSVVRYKDGIWLKYRPSDGVPEDATDIVRSVDGSIWVSGSYQGLGAVARYKADRWTRFTEQDGVIPGPYRLIASEDGSVWAGGLSGNNTIARFNGEGWTRYGPEDGYTGWRLRDALEASDGSLWAIGDDNRRGNFTRYLNRLGSGERRWMPVRLVDGVREAPKRLAEWPEGTLCVLTDRHVLQIPLAEADSEPVWETHTSPERINPKLHSLTVTERGLYFAPVSVRNYGAVHFDGQAWNVLTEVDGLPGDGILRVHGGPDGVVWFVGRSGLSRYEPNDEGGGWTRYGPTHGIQPFRHDWGGQTVIDQGDGTVWVSDDGRVLRFRHEDLPDPETDLRTSVSRVSSEGNLQIQWRGATMWNETPASDLSYKYRLNGQEWVETDDTDVTFTSLDAGNYTFEVFAVAPTMRMEREPAVHTFVVEAPWWQDPRIAVPICAMLIVIVVQTSRVVRSERSLRSANEALSDANNELFGLNESLQLANQEISAQSERKSAFLASMSHELRTPMNAIKGFTNLVLRRIGDEIPDQQRLNLEKVDQASDHLLAQINDLLDLSKIEAGRMDVSVSEFDVREAIEYCVSTVSPLVQEGVELSASIDASVGTASTDEQRVRQMVINLLSNAVKFTDAGSVRVSVRKLSAESGAQSAIQTDQLEISVSDTGKGIPEAELPTLFDEYRQVAGQSESDVQRGTGLGLSITKRFAELLGGTIRVESEVGTGSMFTVRIPVRYSGTP